MGFNVHVTDLVDEVDDDSLEPFVDTVAESDETAVPASESRGVAPVETRN